MTDILLSQNSMYFEILSKLFLSNHIAIHPYNLVEEAQIYTKRSGPISPIPRQHNQKVCYPKLCMFE